MQKEIDFCLTQILRIATTLVPEKNWNLLRIEGYIVGSVTETRSWYTISNNDEEIEYSTFDLDYINEDSDNNAIGNFLEQIRELTYDATRGAWYTIEIRFYKDGRTPTVRYDYYNQPAFEEPIPIALYKQDLKVYPRPAKSIPEWLL
ncbi:hypothetical protein [Hymenobacter weizhouensis]|uniref:hypothetical protein n=1 Tax=Hymenobacter sp. YIM 151500-1 TaxID=2987689 RepID=UPI0022279059|nr:hypothetical protein [Hymenobacter sp. YIM 151500-1]UYZ63416.1 hypothetical protein OIS53_00890 [Hymenobacter sp. YIM 151500-1]